MSHGFLCYSNYLHCSIVTQTTGQAFLVVLGRIAGLSIRTVPRKYGLLTKCEVKMPRYWPSSFFACLWTETKSRSINSQKKKERGQYPAILTEQTWSIKDLLYGFRGNFSCRIQRVVPSGKDSSVLPAWVANHST